MKKSVSIIFASALALSTVFVGCKQDLEENPDATYIEGDRINFTAQIVSGENATKSTAGMADVHVTLSGAGASVEAHTDASGFATFTDLEVGTYTMHAMATDYSTLTAVVEVTTNTGENSNASGQFTLFNMSSTIEGMVYFNSDTTNDTTCVVGPVYSSNMNSCDPDVAPTTMTITAVADLDWWDWNTGSSNMTIADVSYEGLNVSTSVLSDGSYSMMVAGTASGLDYDIYYPAMAIDQKVFDPTSTTGGTTTRRHVFGDMTWSVDAISGVTYVNDEAYE